MAENPCSYTFVDYILLTLYLRQIKNGSPSPYFLKTSSNETLEPIAVVQYGQMPEQVVQLPQIKCNNQGCKFNKTTHIFLPQHMEVSGFAMSFSPTTVCVSRWYLKYGKKRMPWKRLTFFPHSPSLCLPFLLEGNLILLFRAGIAWSHLPG